MLDREVLSEPSVKRKWTSISIWQRLANTVLEDGDVPAIAVQTLTSKIA